MTKLEEKIMEMITFAGEGKSYAFEAIRAAKEEKYYEASEALKKGNESSIKASKSHFALLSGEEKAEFSILLIHAEDQMITSQMMLELAVELIEMYKKINA